MSDVSAENKQKQLILKGNLWKIVPQLAWPAVLGMVLYGLNIVLDAIFVGRFVGETALAGVAIASNLSNISTALGSMIGVGAGSVLSLALGSGDKKTQERLLGNVNLLGFLITAIYMGLGFLFSKQLIALMGGTGEALYLGDDYFKVTVIGSLFWLGGIAGNMIVRSEGRMKTAAWMMAIGLAVNALCNCLFIIILGLGVKGAAWGTNVGMLTYTVIGWLYFGKGRASFKTKTLTLQADKETVKNLLRLGSPALIMSVMTLIQGAVVFNAISRYGTTADVAFYGVVFRLFSFLLTPCMGLMRAAQPVFGINYGAGQYERVVRSYKVFIYASLLLTLPFWLVSILAPGAVLGIMLTEQTLAAEQFMYFRVYMAILPLMSLIYMPMTLFPSIGKPKPAAVIALARQFILYVPAMLLLPKLFGVGGIYYGSLAIDVVLLLFAAIMVKKEFTALKKMAI